MTHQESGAAERMLRTILFIDIVGSTEHASSLGDAAWQRLLYAFNDRIRSILAAFDGREIKMTGDGFLASFDDPAPAISAAFNTAISVRNLDLQVRCGLHLGQVEVYDGDVSGIAVHIGARVAALAGPGEVLVSQTIRDAERGTGFTFVDRGRHVLKGVEGEWRLFSVTAIPKDDPTYKRKPLRNRRFGHWVTVMLISLIGLVFFLARDRVRRDGSASVAMRPAQHRQITFTGSVSEVAVSPSGESIAYADIAENGDEIVRVKDARGVGGSEIARWASPDFLVDLSWSDDGFSIVTSGWSERDGAVISLVFPRLGGSPRKLQGAWYESWSGDGTKILKAFMNSKQVIITELETGAESSRVFPDTSFTWLLGLDWTSGGDRLVYLTRTDPDTFAVWEWQLNEGTARRIASNRERVLSKPRWSHAEDAVYYLRSERLPASLAGILGGDLVRVSVVGSDAEPEVVLGELGISDYAISATGRIVYTRTRAFSNIWISGVDSAGALHSRNLTKGEALLWGIDASPDGRQIALNARFPDWNVFTVPVAGGELNQRTFFRGALIGAPVWSPDGSAIAFARLEESGTSIWAVDAGGKDPARRKATADLSSALVLEWAPDGRILYQTPGHREFGIVSDGGEETRLRIGGDTGWMMFPKFSPDGRALAFYANRHWQSERAPGVYVFSFDSDSVLRVDNASRGVPLGWTSDGQFVEVWLPGSDRVGSVARYRFGESGDAHQKLELKCGEDEKEEVWDVTFVAATEEYICLNGRLQSDVWIADLQ